MIHKVRHSQDKLTGPRERSYLSLFQVGLLPKTVHLDDDVWLADLVYVFDLNIHNMTSAKFKELKPFRVRIDFVGVWYGLR